MKHTLFVILLITSLLAVSCVSTQSRKQEEKIPGFAVGQQNNVPALLSGKIVSISQFGDITLRAVKTYYFDYEEREATIDYVFTNLVNIQVKENSNVEYDTILGTSTEKSKIVARTKELEPFCVYTSDYLPVFDGTYYYYLPSWLQTKYVDLDYKYVELEEYVPSIISFGKENSNEYKVTDDITPIFRSENSKIVLKTILNENLISLENIDTKNVAESLYQNANFSHYSVLGDYSGYECLAYWFNDLPPFLEKEYKYGEKIFLFCTALLVDEKNKKIVFAVEEFNVMEQREIFQRMLLEILNSYK